MSKLRGWIQKINFRNKFIIILFSFFVIALITGTSFAYFSVTREGNINQMVAASLILDFTEGENEINIDPAIPTKDSVGLSQKPYTFTLKNTGSVDATYEIKLVDEEETHGVGTIPKNLIRYTINNEEPASLDTLTDGVLDFGIMRGGGEKNYKLRLWIDYSATNEISGLHYHGKITVSATTKNVKVYGIKRKIKDNSSSSWERIENSVGLVANATKDGSAVTNDFDNIYPWSEIKSYNYNTTSNSITAWIGEENFKFNGTNGEVLTRIPEFYYRRYVEDGYEYMYISDKPYDGYTKSEEFSVGRYKMSEADSKGHSASGTNPSTNKTITQYRNLAKALGTNFGQMDWRYFLLQMLYLVEYADYNSQTKLGNGITGLTYNPSVVALKTEDSTNRIIISSSYANSFIVGQQVDVGTSLGGRQIITYRTVTAINNYDDGTITGTEVIFDGAPINITTDNILYSCGQKSGQTDTLGMKSGTLNNDRKHSVIYRGIEDIIGNIFEWVDGINIKDYQAYINYNPTTYQSDKFGIEEGYTELGYINSNTDGYAKTLGYDFNNPLISFPISVGGESSTYMNDYYYRVTGSSVACVGGGYYSGSSAGLWYWYCSGTSSSSSLTRGARIIKY